ncbi:MAG TPA: hypothetical protein VM165_16675 [Planctomycetaceae bacterium]|nr:hypothetical protein [Planctomycetaceae bacterium]
MAGNDLNIIIDDLRRQLPDLIDGEALHDDLHQLLVAVLDLDFDAFTSIAARIDRTQQEQPRV